jgi:steroid 5-alpha reductase family enzyme
MSFMLTLATLLLLYMTLWFVVSIIKKRNDVADVAWGLGFVLLAWSALWQSDETSVRALVVTLLVSVWGLRLAYHIGKRHIGKPEDFRYAKWRTEWGRWFLLRSYGQIYLLQGFLLFLVSLPVLLIQESLGQPWGWLDTAGLFVWCAGFFFEAVGDAQLARFISDPTNKGKLMQDGLWRFTRHPNYFGEVTQWWGIALMALSVPSGFVGLIGPVTITFLILKVSGVPLLEKKMAEHPDFASYQKRTSLFVPLPPRS